MQLTTARPPILTRIANMAWSFSQRYWRVIVVAMLALLHVAVYAGVPAANTAFAVARRTLDEIAAEAGGPGASPSG